MAKIIITGASGLLGSYLVPALSQDNELHILSRTSVARPEHPAVHHTFDLSTDASFASLPAKADSLIYLAQSEKYRDFPASASEIFQINTVQMVRLLDYAIKAGIQQFVYASTGSVYSTSDMPVSENADLPANGQRGFYASTKLCAEIMAETFAPYMNVALLRFFFIYGKNQKRSMLLPRLADTIRAGASVSLDGPDGISFNPVHASDAAQAVKAALSLRGVCKINVAGPEVLTLRSICNLMAERMRIKPNFQILDKAPQNLIADISEMKKHLVSPTCTFSQGLSDIL